MKIEYRQHGAPVAIGWATLADDASASTLDKISGFQPVPQKQPQVVPLVRSAAPFIADRGNRAWSVSFVVDRQHATPAAAALFCSTHPLLFGDNYNVDLKITIDTQILYLHDAAVVNFQPAPHSDKSTLCAYSFLGKQYNASVPE
jgi:hypothetical protein